MTPLSRMAAVAVSGALALGPPLAAQAQEGSLADYTVADLLKPCQEGDNSARWGAAAEAECEQYIKGFTDAFVLSGGPARDGICLPDQNRLDEVRWAFMRWAYEHFEERDQPAAEGVMATLKARFACG